MRRPGLSTTVEAIRQQGWDGLITMQNAATGTIRYAGAVRAMTAPAARILSGNAAPDFLAAYPDKLHHRPARSRKCPGRQREESYKDG